jgi:hypothetical protein
MAKVKFCARLWNLQKKRNRRIKIRLMTKPDATENDWRLQLIDCLVEAQPEPPALKDLFIRLSSGHFHYTTAQGLKGIIDGKCLWATAASYLNDASEIEYGSARDSCELGKHRKQ